MSVSELLRWQWEGYPRYHRARVNLLVHIVAVPLFLLGNIGLLVAIVQQSSCLTVLTWPQFVPRLSEFGRPRVPRKWGRVLRRLVEPMPGEAPSNQDPSV